MKFKRNLLKIATIAGLIFINCISALAAGDVSECNFGDDIFMKRVSYVPITESNSNDPRADCTGNKCLVVMKGWLYYGVGTGDQDSLESRTKGRGGRQTKGEIEPKISNAPVLIYSHGHDKERTEPCELAKYFVGAGFVVFMPLRRGHLAKVPKDVENLKGWQKIASSGVHIDDYLDNCQKKGNCKCDLCGIGNVGLCSREALDVDYLRKQVADVRDAIDFIKSYPAIGTKGKLADPNRIALIGHSYGGSLTVFANQALNQQNVAIAVSAAELSWDSEPVWESELGCAMREQKRPIYFLQPRNGRSLAPTKTLFGIALEKKLPALAAIFPNAPCSDRKTDKDRTEIYPPNCDESEEKEYRQAHSTFMGRESQIALWGPSVIDFIKRYPN